MSNNMIGRGWPLHSAKGMSLGDLDSSLNRTCTDSVRWRGENLTPKISRKNDWRGHEQR